MSGAWGEGLEALHAIVQICTEARVAYLYRATNRQETEYLLGEVVGRYRRLLSTGTVGASTMCTLASRAPERWEQWERVSSRFENFATTFG